MSSAVALQRIALRQLRESCRELVLGHRVDMLKALREDDIEGKGWLPIGDFLSRLELLGLPTLPDDQVLAVMARFGDAEKRGLVDIGRFCAHLGVEPPTDYVDPDLRRDELPEPYQTIADAVDTVFHRAWAEIQQRERFPTLRQHLRSLPGLPTGCVLSPAEFASQEAGCAEEGDDAVPLSARSTPRKSSPRADHAATPVEAPPAPDAVALDVLGRFAVAAMRDGRLVVASLESANSSNGGDGHLSEDVGAAAGAESSALAAAVAVAAADPLIGGGSDDGISMGSDASASIGQHPPVPRAVVTLAARVYAPDEIIQRILMPSVIAPPAPDAASRPIIPPETDSTILHGRTATDIEPETASSKAGVDSQPDTKDRGRSVAFAPDTRPAAKAPSGKERTASRVPVPRSTVIEEVDIPAWAGAATARGLLVPVLAKLSKPIAATDETYTGDAGAAAGDVETRWEMRWFLLSTEALAGAAGLDGEDFDDGSSGDVGLSTVVESKETESGDEDNDDTDVKTGKTASQPAGHTSPAWAREGRAPGAWGHCGVRLVAVARVDVGEPASVIASRDGRAVAVTGVNGSATVFLHPARVFLPQQTPPQRNLEMEKTQLAQLDLIMDDPDDVEERNHRISEIQKPPDGVWLPARCLVPVLTIPPPTQPAWARMAESRVATTTTTAAPILRFLLALPPGRQAPAIGDEETAGGAGDGAGAGSGAGRGSSGNARSTMGSVKGSVKGSVLGSVRSSAKGGGGSVLGGASSAGTGSTSMTKTTGAALKAAGGAAMDAAAEALGTGMSGPGSSVGLDGRAVVCGVVVGWLKRSELASFSIPFECHVAASLVAPGPIPGASSWLAKAQASGLSSASDAASNQAIAHRLARVACAIRQPGNADEPWVVPVLEQSTTAAMQAWSSCQVSCNAAADPSSAALGALLAAEQPDTESVTAEAIESAIAATLGLESTAVERLRRHEPAMVSLLRPHMTAGSALASRLSLPTGALTCLSDPALLGGGPGPIAALERVAAAADGKAAAAAIVATGSQSLDGAPGGIGAMSSLLSEHACVSERLVVGGWGGGTCEIVVMAGAKLQTGRLLPVHAAPVTAVGLARLDDGGASAESEESSMSEWAAVTASADGELHLVRFTGQQPSSAGADAGRGSIATAAGAHMGRSAGSEAAAGTWTHKGPWSQPRAATRGAWGLRGGSAAWNGNDGGIQLLAQRHDGIAAPVLASAVALPSGPAFILVFEDVDIGQAESLPQPVDRSMQAPPLGRALPVANDRFRGLALMDALSGSLIGVSRGGDPPPALSARGASSLGTDADDATTALTRHCNRVVETAWTSEAQPPLCRPQLACGMGAVASISTPLSGMRGASATFTASDEPTVREQVRSWRQGAAGAKRAESDAIEPIANAAAGADCVVAIVGTGLLSSAVLRAKSRQQDARKGQLSHEHVAVEAVGGVGVQFADLAAKAEAEAVDVAATAVIAANNSVGGLQGSVSAALLSAGRVGANDGLETGLLQQREKLTLTLHAALHN